MRILQSILGEEIIKELQSISQRVTYTNDNTDVFNRDICTITSEDGYENIFDRLDNYREEVELLKEFYIIRYTKGHYIARHNDIWDTKRSYNRTNSLVVQLTDSSLYKGGKTFVYGKDGERLNVPQAIDSGMLFSSYLDHEVEMLEDGVRYSLVACYEKRTTSLF